MATYTVKCCPIERTEKWIVLAKFANKDKAAQFMYLEKKKDSANRILRYKYKYRIEENRNEIM